MNLLKSYKNSFFFFFWRKGGGGYKKAEVFYKKGVLENFAKFTGKHLS